MINNISDEISNISKPQKIIVVGCGKFSTIIINNLSKDGHVIKVIDKSLDVFKQIPKDKIDSNSISTVHGDYTDRHFWDQMNFNDIDIFIASTEIDSCNLFVAQIATQILRIPKVFVILKNDKLSSIYKSTDLKVIDISRLVIDSINTFINNDEAI